MADKSIKGGRSKSEMIVREMKGYCTQLLTRICINKNWGLLGNFKASI